VRWLGDNPSPPDEPKQRIMLTSRKALAAVAGGFVATALIAVASFRAKGTDRGAATARHAASGSDSGPTPPPSSRMPDSTDRSVWKVVVYPDDPVKGADDALVTIVAFSEFESPFCKRAAATLDQVLAAYPNDVRVVWKDNPLPFSPRAKPAATLARMVYAEKGVAAFWRAHDLIFASQPKLGDDDLRLVAEAVGVDWRAAKAAIEANRFAEKIDQSIELGGDVEVKGTPHFFINGRRFAGAQPIEKFTKAVDESLALAKALMAKGVPAARIYEAIVREGKEPPALERKDVPTPDSRTPARGASAGRAVIQQFAEFPCASCTRSAQTLEDVETEYKGRVKVAWRFLVPSTDAAALLVAQVALESFAQGGASAFWTFHERVLDAKERGQALDEPTLLRIATETSIDASKVKHALATAKHKQRILLDAELASKAGITKSPSFVVNGYYLDGNARGPAFKKVINRALRETGY
jgi:protein-disulfide isomerase